MKYFLVLICLLFTVPAISLADESDQSKKRTGTFKPYKINGKMYYPQINDEYEKVGEASWYGPGFHGRRTASGAVYNKWSMTAAHPTLPMNTKVKVTNLNNGREVYLLINDRGPFHGGRIIDVSKAAAIKLAFISSGTAKVKVETVKD